MTVDELREAFLSYFEERGHRRIPSAPLVPHGDPSLLFTAAGMVQFKPYFLGLETPPAVRMTSIQKCFRTTDVEEVGDASHLTYFEMLGNFSIGDYFKAEAIEWSWQFLTGVLGMAPDRLWATVFTDDDEAFELWRGQGLPDDRILRYTAEQGNYWYSGESGPAGPCSELHYDFGPTAACAPCAAGTCHPDVECGRFLEVWNLVFMAFDRAADGSLSPLPAQNVDTGAGLERVAWVLQGARSVYETDELRRILARAEKRSGVAYDPDSEPEAAAALRAITEHARATAFLVLDGVLPGNEGRGYVLRRVLRRAVYFGHTIGLRDAFIADIVDTAIDASSHAHPQLAEQRAFITGVAASEEARFQAVLTRGLELLEQIMEQAPAGRQIPGREMFVLYDTHGLPPELTREVATARGFTVDEAGFEREMQEQRERSKGDTGFEDFDDPRAAQYRALGVSSEFVGYEGLRAASTVASLISDGAAVEQLDTGAQGELVLAQTALYPEGGGQVGDRGEVVTPGGRFRVDDTQSLGEAIVHSGTVTEGTVRTGEAAEAIADAELRAGSERNHTATHLLHSALRQVFGAHVRQAGSLVAPQRLRFDYTHPQAPTAAQLREVQRIVNRKVREDIERETLVLPYEEAIERGAIAFFEDRYSADVRMVEYCELRSHAHDHTHTAECFSRELCGGTHLRSTGGVGHFQIVSDSSIGAGLRRIEALTGPEAERYVEERLDVVATLAQRFKVPVEELDARIDALEAQLAAERRRADAQARQATAGTAAALLEQAEAIDGVQVLIARVDAQSADGLRELGDRLRERLGSSFLTLAAVVEERPLFIAMATADVVARGLRADEVARAAAKVAGGGGGGRPEMAQAGGRDTSQIDAALQVARRAVRERLAGT